jgi:hypothetical protein
MAIIYQLHDIGPLNKCTTGVDGVKPSCQGIEAPIHHHFEVIFDRRSGNGLRNDHRVFCIFKM